MPVSANLVVVVYGKGLLGIDVFLGEVVIPLREVDETGDPSDRDIRAYTLGRRSVKEKVCGKLLPVVLWLCAL